MTEGVELYQAILAVTRDQLTRSMNLSAELEALLALERKKVDMLQTQIDELNSKNTPKK